LRIISVKFTLAKPEVLLLVFASMLTEVRKKLDHFAASHIAKASLLSFVLLLGKSLMDFPK